MLDKALIRPADAEIGKEVMATNRNNLFHDRVLQKPLFFSFSLENSAFFQRG